MQHRIWRLGLFGLTIVSLIAIQANSTQQSQAADLAAPRVASLLEQGNGNRLGQRLLVQADDVAQLATLKAEGATLLVDYGAAQLWRRAATAANANAIDNLPGNLDLLRLRGRDIDTRSPQQAAVTSAPSTNALTQQRSSETQLWLVQFIGPPQDEWLNGLRDIGLTLVGYVPQNGYLVWGDGAALDKLDALVQQDSVVQWAGAFHPDYRLEPTLKTMAASTAITASTEPIEVRVQLYNAADVSLSLNTLNALASGTAKAPTAFRNSLIVRLKVMPDQLATLAGLRHVMDVERFVAPRLRDERQGQLMAGNIRTVSGNTVPTGQGYLTWLTNQGVSTSAGAYPLVAVVDDGVDVDQANLVLPDFYTLGNTLQPGRRAFIQNCSGDAAGSGLAGHGTLNAGIMAGYNNSTAPIADSAGYRYGMGISPFMAFGSTKIFVDAGGFDITRCGEEMSDVVKATYQAGARITSNSWGAPNDGLYTLESAEYDALTRDADLNGENGNQEMLHIFAAGNEGGNNGLAYTLDSPATAKNVIAVGATEGVRDNGVQDGCGEVNADDADDMAGFSSRGPTADGRMKPDIVAPGTHIVGPALPFDTGWDGSGVCGLPNARYYPSNQTHYTWSTGTSHSTPAVAGAAALAYEYYQRKLQPGKVPSPAMIKALLLNTPRYINGVGAGGNLPSPAQGWGTVNLGALYTDTVRQVLDQSVIFHQPGERYVTTGNIVSSTRPLRVTLAWTDAPGESFAAPYGNDLDLIVEVGGKVYHGNMFVGDTSVPSTTWDFRNNVENVFLPVGVSGPYTITVVGYPYWDGVPNVNADETDQDFALVVSNGTALSAAVPGDLGLEWSRTELTTSRAITSDLAPLIQPGDRVSMVVTMTNVSGSTASNVVGTLSSNSNVISLVNRTSGFANLAAGASGRNETPFVFSVAADATCGDVNLVLSTTYQINAQPKTMTEPFTLHIGQGYVVTPSVSYTSTSATGVAIPDNRESGITSTIVVPASSDRIDNVRVHINRLDHTYTSDLRLRLIAPSGESALLIGRRGFEGNNFVDLVLDDASENSLALLTSAGPFSGTYYPETPLGVMWGNRAEGQWKLVVQDVASGDTGKLFSWSLEFATYASTCTLPPGPTATPSPTATATQTPTPTQTPTATPPNVCSAVAVAPNIAIPDNKTSMTCVDLPVSDVGKVTNAALLIGITHTWVSDLRFVLQSPDGKTLTLLNRPGLPATRNGNASDLQARYPITFSQSGLIDAEKMGSTTSSQVICRDDGKCSYLPNPDGDISSTVNSLAGFAGSNSSGTWKFCVNDNYVNDVGRLANVRLDLTCEVAATVTPGPSPTPTATPSPTPIGDYCAAVTIAPNVVISDNVAAPNCYDVQVNDEGTVTSATLKLALTHPYVGDLKVQLRNPDGVTVTVLNRAGVPTSQYGDSSDLNASYPITLAQNSPNDAEKMGNTVGGTGVICRDDGKCSYFPNPNGDLSSAAGFDGLVGFHSKGTWRVCVNDLSAKDVGRLSSATLDLTCSAPNDAPTPVPPSVESLPTETPMPPNPSLDKLEEPDYKYDVWLPIVSHDQ